MKRFTLIGKNGNEISFTYNDTNSLVSFDGTGIEQPAALSWMLQNLPISYTALVEMQAKNKGFELVEIPFDLTFEHFWNTYDYKNGNKARACKMWEKLNDTDKVKALNAISRYNRFLKVKTNQDKAYPETYLFQRRFENEFKA